MASPKKRRKAGKVARLQQQPTPTKPFRHPDGDRRRRGGPIVEQAIKDKEILRQIGAPDLGDDEDS